MFEALVRLAPGLPKVKMFLDRLDINSSTFTSRFHRLLLPSPKNYLSSIRLIYAAAFLELPGLSLSDVAYRLEYSTEFRARYPFDVALDDFLERMIVPFQRTFSTFHPLDQGVGYLGHNKR